MTFTWWNWLWWRVVREWDLTLMKGGVSLCITWQYRVMKGGARVRLDLDEGWCEPLHYMTIQQKRTDLDEGWCETLHYITIHKKRTDLDEGWLWDCTLNNNTSGKNWLWVLQRVVVPVCVVLCGSWISGCRLEWNGCFILSHGCMNVAWAMFWGGSRSTKPCVFPCKVAAAGDERYLVCAAGAAGVVSVANCSSYVFCNEWLFLCA